MDTIHYTRLSDERQIAWSAWGAEAGEVVLFCHGAGMAGALPFGEDIAPDLDMRIICVDRPGLGQSDADPAKSFESWASDIRQLLASLCATKAKAIGFSQGAAFALALAAEGLVQAVAIVSGQDELSYPLILAQLPGPVAQMVARANADPVALEAEISATASADWLWQMIEVMSGDQDRRFYASAMFAPRYRAALAAGFRQGAAGYARDTVLAMAPWPFRLEDIPRPVRLWYGADDTSPVHSPDLGRTLAKRLPAAALNQVDHEGSTILWTRANAILEDLQRAAP